MLLAVFIKAQRSHILLTCFLLSHSICSYFRKELLPVVLLQVFSNLAKHLEKKRGRIAPLLVRNLVACFCYCARYRNVTICALVQAASGLNWLLLVPPVMSFWYAHVTASS